MKYSGIGGQAVMEGIMMRNQDKYAVAVRKSDKKIDVQVFDYKGPGKNKSIKSLPIIRGVISFVDSLYLGMKTLMHSASFFEDEEEMTKKKEKRKGLSEAEIKELDEKEKKEEDIAMVGTVVLSILLTIGMFFVLPYFISMFFQKFIQSRFFITILEGIVRLAIFITYIGLISFMPEIKRTFMYHGAEHKCINCIEQGLELNVENVRKSSKQHKRCGTSFLLIVMIISVVFFMFIQVDSPMLRLGVRLLLIPVIAGVSYEFIRLAGRYDNVLVNLISVPGLLMQRLTTKEPDDDMIEVGIASVEAVFDWKKWQEEELK